MKLFLFLLISFYLNASTIEFNYAKIKFEDFNLLYLADKNASLTIDEVRESEFSAIKNMHSFSGNVGVSWYKIVLKNPTDLDRKISLHNNFAYFLREADIFEFQNNLMRDKNRYNILEDSSSNRLIGSTLVHKIDVPAQDEITVFMKNTPMVSTLFDLNIYDENSSLNALSENHFYSIVIIAIMLTLSLYNATLYFFNKRKEFLFYALYMIVPTLGLTYKYGIIFSYFHLYGESTYWLNLTAIVMPVFLLLFIKQLLNTKKMNKKIDTSINTLLVMMGLNVLYALFVDLMFGIELFKIIFLFTTATIIYMIIYLFRASHPLATIFTAAYSAYFAGLIITILAMSGTFEMSFFTFHSGGIGIIIEGLLFSYLMHYNVKLLEKEITEQREVIITKNKKAQLGDMISAITHQWKQPLARIASITSLMEFKLLQGAEISTDELKEKIVQINTNTTFLSDTIDDFKDFFNSNQMVDECDIADIINRVISISNDDTLTKEVSITTELNFKNRVSIYKNELLHIILNIVQNAKEAFDENNENVRLIKIIGYTKDKHNYIDIIDNAGGISEENMPFIFNEYYTTKEKKAGSGLGLYLSKIILEDRLNGTIEAIKIENGTMFRIVI